MKKRNIYKICIITLILFLLFISGNIFLSANSLTVREFETVTKKTARDIRFIVLSDLHCHEFGEQNKRLVKKVSEQHPDLILLDGDFLNEDSEDSRVLCELVEALSELAPVYFAIGNHEEVYMQKNGTVLLQELEAAGAAVLEEKYVDLEINGTALRLGGMYEYAFGTDGKSGENMGEAIPEERGKFLGDFQNTDRLKIMMSHRPDSFIFGNAASYWDVDLVVSGHNHGGQVVVPFKGGLFGGDQGWFPKYVHGMYEKNQMKIFITSGLGSHGQKLPRFNNWPEVAVVTVKAE